MTYNAQEVSAYSGAPAELYEFQRGATYWRYTSADELQTLNGYPYTCEPISRTDLDEGTELNRTHLKITLPRSNAVAELFRLYPPSEIVTVKVWRRHRGDTEFVLIWLGRVLNCEWRGGEADLYSEPALTSIRRNGLRRFYQRTCPHVLYGTSACRVAQDAYRTTGSVSAVSGITVTVQAASAHPDGYFSGGFMTTDGANSAAENRMITGHTGAQITLAAPVPSLGVGQAVTLFPGCDHTLSTCTNKFNNSLNYGGWPYIPLKNPFNLQVLY